MSKYLKSREFCPLHRSLFCTPCHKERKFRPGRAGRKEARTSNRSLASAPFGRASSFKPAVTQVEDPHHPRGYREVCNDRELTRRKKLMIEQAIYEGTLACVHCGEDMTKCSYDEIQLCHKTAKGMGGSTHDDHWSNLALGHAKCNFENGSRRVA